MPGEALDIGIGADGSVWIASFEGIYFWNGLDWDRVYGDAIDISVGPDGMPWVTNMFAELYRGI